MFDRDLIKKIQKKGMSLRLAYESAFKTDRRLSKLRLQKAKRWGIDVTVIGNPEFDRLHEEITRLELDFPIKFRAMIAAAIKAGEISASGLKVPVTHDRERVEISSAWFEDQAAVVALRRSEIRRREDRKLLLKFEGVRVEAPKEVRRFQGRLKQDVLSALDDLKRSKTTKLSKIDEARLVAEKIGYNGNPDNIRRMIAHYTDPRPSKAT